jgi:glutamine synthetase
MGNSTFHPNRINWSYRNRGSVARIQKNKNRKE